MLLKYNRDRRLDAVADNNNLKVVVNEIEQSIASGDDESAKRLCVELKNSLSKKVDESSSDFTFVILPALISVIGVITILFYVDRSVLRPFRKLKNYAADVSKGNLDKSLQVERGNYFGDFTWAFDNMRREIVKSRASEKEAIENNKTVIATLSHDIKTPVASIRAYAEAFEANMDSTPEKRQKYISTLMEKCDEVTKLTNDLFLHSISEMNKLEV
ncbi:MAG: sensor histidine kinase, partial [Eubacterium sp.]|nr:sensor histidine kinase [Eubacterium sp.]